MNIQELQAKTVLFLGKTRAFSEDEFFAQVHFHKLSLVRELDENVDVVLEGRMMSPYEQNLSDELYERGGCDFIPIESFEKLLAQKIDADTLLMGLKLSNDREKLKNFLQNSMLDDALYFKLLKMYNWGGEDFFENDDNRDVTAALIGRFYENIERNHNVQYATTGIYHLIAQTSNAELLEAIAALEPLHQHPKMVEALARHEKVPTVVLKRFLKKDSRVAKKAMAYNPKLPKGIVQELFKEQEYREILARNVVLDEALFEDFLAYKTALAQNESLTRQMQQKLLDLDEQALNFALAANKALNKEILAALLEKGDEELNAALLENPVVEQTLLEKYYKSGKYKHSLAKNPATPAWILEELFTDGDVVILEALARNENTPVDILYQLQLESKFERAVKTNAAFGKYIQSENIGWKV